jgi:regulator of protease activity HflC (stomatin/prohibitin superfamily)
MSWFFSMILAVVVCGGIFLLGRQLRREARPDTPEADRGLLVSIAGLVIFFVWVGLHTGISVTRQVEAGHIAIVYEFGEIVGQRGEGLQFIAPWQTTRSESIQVQRRRFDNVTAFSAETQDVFINATVNYRVAPAAVQELFRTVGPNWFDTLVEARINNFFKEEMVQYETVDVAPNRETIRAAVLEKLRQDLDQYSISVVELLIDDIDFQTDFKLAIEQKQIATQDALREQERIVQRQAEAQQAIAVAEGSAEAVRIAAAGEADAITLRAEAQAAANQLIAVSLTDQVISFAAVQTLADNIQIALIPSGEGILIDPATLIGTNPGGSGGSGNGGGSATGASTNAP